MSSVQNFAPNEADKLYSHFEQTLACAWAQAHLSDFMRRNPNAPAAERKQIFLDALEGGLGIALELRHGDE